jgi:O-antigen ligase
MNLVDLKNIPSTVVSLNQKPSIRIPFINTTLLFDLKLFFVLQPLFWWMGVEQILPVGLAFYLLIKRILSSPQIRAPRSAWWILAFFLWQSAHIISLPDGELDLFVKTQGTWATILILFLLIYNVADSEKRWYEMLYALENFGRISIILGTLYITGLFKPSISTLINVLLPSSLINGSHFFSTIAIRTLGRLDFNGLPRVQGTFWHPSSYASILLVFLAIQWFLIYYPTSGNRQVRWLFYGLTLINLVFTFSRTTYVSFLMMCFMIWWLNSPNFNKRIQKVVLLLMGAVLVLAFTLFILIQYNTLSLGFIDNAIYNYRPNSVLVRLQIYQVSWDLISQKPIWGWGTTLKLEELPTKYSAGSHSFYLSILFRFGLVGLFLYLGLIGTILWNTYKSFLKTIHLRDRYFFVIIIALLIAMLIRQATSNIFWDLYVTSTIWAILALNVKNIPLPDTFKKRGMNLTARN